MPLDKEKAQDVIDDFVITNDVELNEISTQNPALFDATLNALNFLSSRFGTGQKMQIIEKPKVVQEVVQGGLPFKEGDNFKLADDRSGQVYKLSDINLKDDQVMLSWYSLSDKKDKSYIDSIKEVTKRFNEGNWVLVDVFPYKVGDTFVVEIMGKVERVDIKGIRKDGTIELFWVNDNANGLLSKEDVLKEINSGKWRKIESISQLTSTPTFEVGQILYDTNEEELFEIREVTSNGITLKSASGNVQFKDSEILEKKLGGIGYILASYKIGDRFTSKNDGVIYTIYQLSTSNKNDVILKMEKFTNNSIVSKNWDTINTNIYDGVWQPLIATQPQQLQPTTQLTQTTQDNPYNIKIGDLIVTTFNDSIWEVLDVNVKQDSVKLMTSSNRKETENLSVLNIKIDDDDNEKLAFSMFDTFVNPNGDFYKIMELYPNNEKSVYVKVNDKPGLEVYQWDIIQVWIEDTFWMPATKAEADQIKADVLKAEEEAKAPKKKLTKLQKQIIDLQQEIDGLLFLADEDADAKAELEKKLIQIEGLKAKKP
jgi:hypothetical protein